ncbi:MAG: nucleotidyltransferase family protein [Acidobacteria bacterium]|nr:nucleotidyltransferase family protein [Acidobacteriota bacterium]
MRLAVLLLFCDPVPEQCSHLLELSDKDWERLLRWLDLSGLALYFLDRIVALKLCNLLPTSVFTRLHLNLIDNTERTRRMLLESAAIQLKFQQAGISYAVLKGISLWPAAVAKPELRSQFDMDYLVAETDLPAARRILETDGYRLYAVSGKSSEFKKNERPGVSLKDIYKHFGSYGVELHAVKSDGREESALNRIQRRDVNGTSMPVLNPVDLFLGHGMHTFKHLCGEYARASQFLEFRRHVLRFQDDEEFWLELRRVADGNLRVTLGLGVVLLLTSEVMGNFVPYGLASWTVDRLPDRLRLWVRTYGHRAILGEFPGTKLYLLLQQELEECGVVAKRATRNSLFPAQLPPPVIRPVANEGLDRQVRRYAMHLGTILSRAQFHVTEGVRYAVETRRWRRIKESVR